MLRWHFSKWLLVLLAIHAVLELTPIPEAHDFFGIVVPILLAGMVFHYIRKHRHLLREFLIGLTLVVIGQLLDWVENILNISQDWPDSRMLDDFFISSGFFMLGLALIKLILSREQLIQKLHKEITRRRELQQAAEFLASHDEMTTLGNRRALFQRLESARFDGEDGTLLYLDVNHFKQVNDELGHQVGDELLKQISHIIRHRHADSYRIGGDEFVILLQGDHESVQLKILELHQDVAPLTLQYGISLAIGQRRYQSEELSNPDQVLMSADESMYANKKNWRTRMRKNS